MSGTSVGGPSESGFQAVSSVRDDFLAPRPVSSPEAKAGDLDSAWPGFRGLLPGPSGYLVVAAGVPGGCGVAPE